jgi:hypothetical protein
LVALLLGALVGGAAAQETRTLRVEPFRFVRTRSSVRHVIKLGGLGSLCTLQGSGQFVAPVDVPDGNQVVGISASFDDDNKDAFGLLSLFRVADATRELVLITDMSDSEQRPSVVSAMLPEPAPALPADGSTHYVLQATLTGKNVCLREARLLLRASR